MATGDGLNQRRGHRPAHRRWLPRGSLDLIECIQEQRNAWRRLNRLARYGRLINDRLAVHVLPTGPGVRFLMGAADAKPLHPQRAEFSIALALRLARQATAAHLIPVEVLFAHAAPADRTEHQAFFSSPIHFSSGVNGMVFRDADGARALQAADAALGAVIRRRLDKARKTRQTGRACRRLNLHAARMPVVDRRHGKGETVGHDDGLDGIERADASRRLAEESTSFRDIR